MSHLIFKRLTLHDLQSLNPLSNRVFHFYTVKTF